MMKVAFLIGGGFSPMWSTDKIFEYVAAMADEFVGLSVDMGRNTKSGRNVGTIAEDGRGSICVFCLVLTSWQVSE
jgi:hypothetical protein